MKKFILLFIFLFLLNISIISNQVFAEESNQSDQQISDSNLNESNISNIDIDKYENEDLNTNLETDNNTNDDVEDFEDVEFKELNQDKEILTINDVNEHKENKNIDSTYHDVYFVSNDKEQDNRISMIEENTLDKNFNNVDNIINENQNTSVVGKEYLEINNEVEKEINGVETIIDTDDRKIVNDISRTPNKSIVYIKTFLYDNSYYRGTGFIIDDYAVLTAAHVITAENKNEKIKDIYIYAGYKFDNSSEETARVIKSYVLADWINNPNINHDMALLILDKPLGKTFEKLNIIDRALIGEVINTIGYPGKDNGEVRKGNQYYSSGKIVKVTNNNIFYDLDTEGGQSGSPIFNENKEVIAIHTNGFDKRNSYKFNLGLRLTSNNIETINEWKNELKIENFNKYIYINEKNAKVWKDLNFKELYKNDKDILDRVYKAENLYTDSLGGKYLLIKDKNYQFIGFININDITEINATSTNLSVQLKKENIKHFRNLFEDVKTDTKLSFNTHYKVKYTYRLPNNRIIYSLYDKNDKWQGYVLNKDVNEIKFEPYDERVEIIKNNYTVWGDFFGKKNLDTKSIYHKVFNAKGIYKDKNNNRTYLKIYDSKDKYLGILNISATKKVVPQSFNKNVKVVSKNHKFYSVLFDTVRDKSQNYLNKKLHSKYLYKFSNGKIYYSLYDNKDKWIGYIEKEAVKIL
ncbi:trypsin-like peptidase domain-containing protein [Mammaliicoccus sciuri]|uniref:trypsin-like serine peptidase n=1 Tax=Mammaliicoccus sciuri TaxID=1296 RepID=UPI002DBD8B92|nr:trypsin-like peptidase domain-containing protein [Mammaliicoccus sciuri]MEB6226448.1 trypsin-like peptidase domain-containing protein [Mammaliicoccus sciuri]